MKIEFDPAKDRANAAKHGMSLVAAEGFDWDTALEREDDRFDYGGSPVRCPWSDR